MSDDRAAFLGAICAAPDDDAPRLAFADWLEERGEGERAEFIRVQIELARAAHDDPRRPALAARDKELRRHNRKWRRVLPQWLRYRGHISCYDRGFWLLLEFDLFAWSGGPHGPGRRPMTAALGPDPHHPVTPEQLREALALNPFRGLSFDGVTPQTVLALASIPHAASLRSLHLFGMAKSALEGAEEVRALVRSRYLTRLTDLGLRSHRLGDEGARAIATGKMRNLTALWLSNCAIEDEGVVALARSSALANLAHLDLSFNRFGEEGVRALIASRHLKKLGRLNVSRGRWPGPRACDLLREHFGRRLYMIDPDR